VASSSEWVSGVNSCTDDLRLMPVRETCLVCQKSSEVVGGVNGVEDSNWSGLPICRCGVTGESGDGDGGVEIELDGDNTSGVAGMSPEEIAATISCLIGVRGAMVIIWRSI
jgi:hypothetical protein